MSEVIHGEKQFDEFHRAKSSWGTCRQMRSLLARDSVAGFYRQCLPEHRNGIEGLPTVLLSAIVHAGRRSQSRDSTLARRSPITAHVPGRTAVCVGCGLGVAAFHEYLVVTGKLECPPALFGWGDGPVQSLAVFLVLTTVCLAGAFTNCRNLARQGLPSILLAIFVGVAVAWACVASAPPLPPSPSQPYDPAKQPFDMCRPPFARAF